VSTFSRVISGLIVYAAATVAQAACFVSASGMSFGAYDVSDSYPRDSMLMLTLSCHEMKARDLSVSIGPSANSGGIPVRQMKWTTGGDRLSYNLFTDASRTQVWGEGAGGGAVVVQGVSQDNPQQLWVFGRIPPGQDVSAGTYGDDVTITVEILK
jgi:spore coat protein U-like protein